MFSLLTKKYASEAKKEYYSRLLFVSLIFLIITALTLLLSLTPVYYFSNLRNKALSDQLDNLKKNNVLSNEAQVDELVKNFNETLAVISPELNKLPTKDRLLDIIKMRAGGISLKNLSWTDKPAPNGKFFVRGIASDRDSLQKYIQALQAEKIFSAVEFSRNSYYTKDTDIDFSIDLTYKP